MRSRERVGLSSRHSDVKSSRPFDTQKILDAPMGATLGVRHSIVKLQTFYKKGAPSLAYVSELALISCVYEL